MKTVITLILILVACAFAKRPSLNNIKKGSELIRLIEGDLPGTYLIFFYDRNSDQGRVQEFRNQARQEVLSKHPDLLYYEIDVDDADFQDVVELAQIDRVQTDHMPTFWITTNGLGYTVHGEDAVKNLVESLATKDWWLAHRHQKKSESAEKGEEKQPE